MAAGADPGKAQRDQIIAAGGLGLAVVDVGAGEALEPAADGVVRLGLHRGGARPQVDPEAFDILLSADADAPAPWVGLGSPVKVGVAVAHLAAMVEAQPVAAGVACQVLRAGPKLNFGEALAQESIAYSMLLASEGFRAWRAAHPARTGRADDGERVSLERREGVLQIRLNRPAARNAVDAAMRDALAEALDFALADGAPVVLSGAGPSFSAGGDLDEFGAADDPGRAHAIRVLRSATGRVARLGSRITARVHGACIGAGIEIPAAAGWLVAHPEAVFRLPEVGMGLIPGAGGTASIPRRIGRHRAAYMALTGFEIDTATALDWRLVDALEPGG
jgi:hypothetical protein